MHGRGEVQFLESTDTPTPGQSYGDEQPSDGDHVGTSDCEVLHQQVAHQGTTHPAGRDRAALTGTEGGDIVDPPPPPISQCDDVICITLIDEDELCINK